MDGRTDGRTEDGRTDRCNNRLSYRDAHDAFSDPNMLRLSTICSKISISLVFNESVTNRRTDGPTDGWEEGQTDPVV